MLQIGGERCDTSGRLAGLRCETCGRLGRQVGPEETPGGSGGLHRGSLGGFENGHFLFVRCEFVSGLMKY